MRFLVAKRFFIIGVGFRATAAALRAFGTFGASGGAAATDADHAGRDALLQFLEFQIVLNAALA